MKSQIIGVLFIVAGFLAMMWNSMQSLEQRRAMEERQQMRKAESGEASSPIASSQQQQEDGSNRSDESLVKKSSGSSQEGEQASGIAKPTPQKSSSLFSESSGQSDEQTDEKGEGEKLPVSSEDSLKDEITKTIENDFIRVVFTNRGGAIKKVELIARDTHGQLQYPDRVGSEEPYSFNEISQLPALALSWIAGEMGGLKEYAPIYELVKHKGNEIAFRLITPEGIEIIRGYRLPQA